MRTAIDDFLNYLGSNATRTLSILCGMEMHSSPRDVTQDLDGYLMRSGSYIELELVLQHVTLIMISKRSL